MAVCLQVLQISLPFGVPIQRDTTCRPIDHRLRARCRRALPPLDPLSLKLRAHPDQQGRSPEDAPGLHKPDRIANSKVSAGGRHGLVQVEGQDEQPEQVPRPVEPRAAGVRDGEVEDGQGDGAEDGVGHDEGLEGAGGELVAELQPVEVADVGAEVGQAVGQGDGHVEADGPPW